MAYFLTAAVLLFLPGYCLVRLAGLAHIRYLLSFSLSYALYFFTLKYTQSTGMSVVGFEMVYISTILVLIIAASLQLIWQLRAGSINLLVNIKGYSVSHKTDIIAIAGIVVVVIGYFSYAGPYLEVPSDVLRHLEYIKQMSGDVAAAEASGRPLSEQYLGLNGKYWHYLYVFISTWSGHLPVSSIFAASLFNVLVLVLGVYFFSKVVLREMFKGRTALISASLVASVFFFLHFGVNIFSFVRYYTLAPVMLNLVLYFTVMSIAIQFFRSQDWPMREMLAAVFVLYASLHVHMQEGLFAVIMVLLMSGYLFFQAGRSILDQWQPDRDKSILIRRLLLDKSTIVFIPLAMMTLGFHAYSYLHYDRNQILQPKLIPLDTLLPFVKNLYILNPTYQFYYVITLWGLAVILLFALNWRRFRNNSYIIAGMLSPLFTIFNPVFVDLFLRHSLSIMLWRLSFLVPIYFVAGYLLITALTRIWNGRLVKKVMAGMTVLLLVMLLFPVHTVYIDSPYSRLVTLKRVNGDVSPEHWGDLLAFLDMQKKPKRIITDPVTGYVVNALTKHSSPRDKIHRRWGYVELNYDDYSQHPFDRYAGSLFVVNKRNGGMSETGRIARHWPEEILQVEKYYQNDKLEAYIDLNPERFELLWSQDRIRVFSVRRPG